MKRTYLFPTFFLCLLFAVGIVFFFRNNNIDGVHSLFSPIQKQLIAVKNGRSSDSALLQQENMQLRTQLAHMQLEEKDMQALRDQFSQNQAMPAGRQESQVMNQNLLPAHIVSMPHFSPGGELPSVCILDKGQKDGVYSGQPVVIKNILIGTVVKASNFYSQVKFTLSEGTYLTVKNSRTGALGVLKGKGDHMTLENVLLSDTLSAGDAVATVGNLDASGRGVPAGLIIGTIASVEKNPSALFQKANIKPLVDVTALSILFLLTPL